MSLNLTVVAHEYIACATDRRLTKLDGTVVSERSMKLTAFTCGTGCGFLTYNGIGCDGNGVTPSDWLADIPDLGTLSIRELAQRIKALAEPKLAELSAAFGGNPRHTFVMGAFEGKTPVMGMISNYESLDPKAECAPIARDEMTVEMKTPRKSIGGGLVATGNIGRARRTIRDWLYPRVRSGRPAETVLRHMIKAVRDSSYGQGRKGSVGTSVATGVWPLGRSAIVKVHVVVGSAIEEMPNFITLALDSRTSGCRACQSAPLS